MDTLADLGKARVAVRRLGLACASALTMARPASKARRRLMIVRTKMENQPPIDAAAAARIRRRHLATATGPPGRARRNYRQTARYDDARRDCARTRNRRGRRPVPRRDRDATPERRPAAPRATPTQAPSRATARRAANMFKVGMKDAPRDPLHCLLGCPLGCICVGNCYMRHKVLEGNMAVPLLPGVL